MSGLRAFSPLQPFVYRRLGVDSDGERALQHVFLHQGHHLTSGPLVIVIEDAFQRGRVQPGDTEPGEIVELQSQPVFEALSIPQGRAGLEHQRPHGFQLARFVIVVFIHRP
jgi:hypothetical protein